MDTSTYDETRLKRDEDWARYLKEGADVNLLFWNGRVIGVDPPQTVELTIAATEPNVKGNTVSGGHAWDCLRLAPSHATTWGDPIKCMLEVSGIRED